MWIRKLLTFLVVVALIGAAYIWVAMKWSYSTGERAGMVQKFSNKGWLCKTWEGELAMVSMPGTSVEKFYFTVRDDAVAKTLAASMGRRVNLHYEEKVGLPTSCFGETRHFVTSVTQAPDVPLGVGISTPPAATPTPAVPAATPVQTAPAAQTAPAPAATTTTTAPAPAPAPAPAATASGAK